MKSISAKIEPLLDISNFTNGDFEKSEMPDLKVKKGKIAEKEI